MTVMKKVLFFALLAGALAACEKVDTTVKEYDPVAVPLEDVARILAALPVGSEQWNEVHAAVQASTGNGYDSEYTLKNLFTRPGTGVGAAPEAKAAGNDYAKPLREWIGDYVQNLFAATKASETGEVSRSGYNSAQEYLNALTESDIQIYWPFSEEFDKDETPVITFDPGGRETRNIGWIRQDDGSVEEVVVDEKMARERPVWVINRNRDAEYPSLEMRRREDPDWGRGGGLIGPAKAGSAPGTRAGDHDFKTLVLRSFKANRQFDTWFCGGSEIWVKCGAIEDFWASTDAELRLYSPSITDFLIVIRRKQVGEVLDFNAVLVSEWTGLLDNCAFMMVEDDGGTMTTWKCAAMVKYNSRSYGFEIEIPLRARDDIIWRGALTRTYIERNNGVTGHFGDVELVLELI